MGKNYCRVRVEKQYEREKSKNERKELGIGRGDKVKENTKH